MTSIKLIHFIALLILFYATTSFAGTAQEIQLSGKVQEILQTSKPPMTDAAEDWSNAIAQIVSSDNVGFFDVLTSRLLKWGFKVDSHNRFYHSLFETLAARDAWFSVENMIDLLPIFSDLPEGFITNMSVGRSYKTSVERSVKDYFQALGRSIAATDKPTLEKLSIEMKLSLANERFLAAYLEGVGLSKFFSPKEKQMAAQKYLNLSSSLDVQLAAIKTMIWSVTPPLGDLATDADRAFVIGKIAQFFDELPPGENAFLKKSTIELLAHVQHENGDAFYLNVFSNKKQPREVRDAAKSILLKNRGYWHGANFDASATFLKWVKANVGLRYDVWRSHCESLLRE